MKLKYELEIVDIDDEIIAVPLDCDDSFRGILRLNGTTADILRLLENEVTEDYIVSELESKYDAPEEKLRQDLMEIIGRLSSAGLLTE